MSFGFTYSKENEIGFSDFGFFKSKGVKIISFKKAMALLSGEKKQPKVGQKIWLPVVSLEDVFVTYYIFEKGNKLALGDCFSKKEALEKARRIKEILKGNSFEFWRHAVPTPDMCVQCKKKIQEETLLNYWDKNAEAHLKGLKKKTKFVKVKEW